MRMERIAETFREGKENRNLGSLSGCAACYTRGGSILAYYTFRFAPRVATILSACYTRR